MSYYPPGAANDPRAPWNQPEGVECPDCEGTGRTSTNSAGRSVGSPLEAEDCPTCWGDGVIDPPEDEGPDPDDLRDAEFDRRLDR